MASTAEEAHLMGEDRDQDQDQDQASLDDDYDPHKKPSQPQRRKLFLVLIYGGIGFVSVLLATAMYVLSSHTLSSLFPLLKTM